MEILEFLKVLGSFTVISQVILHFCAGDEYSKYAKILTSFSLLAMIAFSFGKLTGQDFEEKMAEQMQCYQSQMEEFDWYYEDTEEEPASNENNFITVEPISIQNQIDGNRREPDSE